uniref:Ig-like domain-containing protein n=1 Tax=Seriola dumerili TaxID=41447 RepID=A0A3B4UNZ1_SERDU
MFVCVCVVCPLYVCCVCVSLYVFSQHALGVEVYEGAESVLLPCQVSVSVSKDSTVVWNREEFNSRKVHVYQNGSDRPEEQNQVYRDRTEMKEDPLRTGDLSLTLKHPTERDRYNYTCRVYKDGDFLRGTRVFLNVKGQCCLFVSGCLSLVVCLWLFVSGCLFVSSCLSLVVFVPIFRVYDPRAVKIKVWSVVSQTPDSLDCDNCFQEELVSSLGLD